MERIAGDRFNLHAGLFNLLSAPPKLWSPLYTIVCATDSSLVSAFVLLYLNAAFLHSGPLHVA